MNRKLIHIGLVNDLFTGPVKKTYEKSKPIVEDTRKQLNYPQLDEWFEYLHNEIQKREQTLQPIQ